MLDAGEECDDGNDDDNDECLSTCVLPPSPCGMQSYEANIMVKPVDIIFVIDNSDSMGEEIKGVQDNINQNFAAIFEDSGLDYRVIMVSRHGSWSGSQSVCIEAPLSGIPQGGCETPPAQPVHNPGKFYHYSVSIASRNPWCKLLEHFPETAEDQFGEMGFRQWLREDSLKTIVAISDDGIECSYNGITYNDLDMINAGQDTAEQFDADFLALSPEMFGNSLVRKYNYYSIVGLAFNDPPEEPYVATDPMTNASCPSAANPGTGHQALSVLTQSLRFPLCDTSSYDAVFQSIAQGVLAGTAVSCEFPLPMPPNNFEIDPNSIEIYYTPMGMGEPIKITQILNKENCGPNNFYIEGDTMHLCPSSCELVQNDFEAKIDIEYACKQEIG